MKKILIIICAAFFLVCLAIPQVLTAQLHHANQDLPCVNKNFNILAHVAVDSIRGSSGDREPIYSERQLLDMVDELNEYFSPICVSFTLCEINVLEDDYSLGRIRNQPLSVNQRLQELKNRFTLRRRINVFFLDYIHNEYCGTSTFEGIFTPLDANIFTETGCLDGIAEQVGHHLGHIFGLRNTYDPFTVELVDGSNCLTAGDLLCDTPADPFGQSTEEEEQNPELIEDTNIGNSFFTTGCEFISEVLDPNGEYYQPDMGNMMSIYPCKCGFTQDQFRLMAKNIRESDIRHF